MLKIEEVTETNGKTSYQVQWVTIFYKVVFLKY